MQMSRNELLQQLCAQLQQTGMTRQEAMAEARYDLTFILDISVSDLLLHGTDQVTETQEEQLRQIVQKRATGCPLAYILGERYFMGMPFFVQPGVLIPRQETELLCEQAAEVIRAQGLRSVLDLCTGSGCIAISLAKLTDAEVTALDISDTALQTAGRNAELLQAKVQLLHSDLFLNVDRKYDMITANPPYITAAAYAQLEDSVRVYEPELALLGGDDGLDFYRRIAKEAPEYLNPGGYLVQEIGYDQGEAVRELLAAQGFVNIEIRQDYAGLDRMVWANLPL